MFQAVLAALNAEHGDKAETTEGGFISQTVHDKIKCFQ